MDFARVLALAKKKQSFHDSQVKRIDEQVKIKDAERKRQLQVANKINEKPVARIESLDLTALETSRSCVISSKNKSSPGIHNGTKPKQCDVVTPKHSNTIGQKVEVLPSNKTPRNKPSKMSFSEILELAKKNVQDKCDKKRPFEELIPCSYNSKYRKVDTDLAHCRAKERHSSDHSLKEISDLNRPRLCLNAHHKKSEKPQSSQSVMERSASELEKSMVKPQANKTLINNAFSVDVKSTTCSFSLCGKANSKLATKKQSKLSTVKPLLGTTKTDSAVKYDKSSNRPTGLGVDKLPSKIKPKPCAPSKYEEAQIKSNQFSRDPKQKITNRSENTLRKSINTPVYHPPTDVRTPLRGIAAQLGANLSKPVTPTNTYSDDGDDYLSDDSFIDDSEAIQTKEYARLVRDIHKTLHFDPTKYKEVNPWDDLSSMEAKYRDIEKEERKSARLGALEDNEEMLREVARKKKKLKRKQSLLN